MLPSGSLVAVADVTDPIRRQRYRFQAVGEDLHVEVWCAPGGDVPEHSHPRQRETWEVIGGDVTFWIDGRERRATAGDRLVAEPGIGHRFINTGATEAHLRVEVSPGLELQAFLEGAAALARAGAFDRRGLPRSLRQLPALADFALRFRHVTVIASPPVWLQDLLFPPLARLHAHRSMTARRPL